LTPYRVGRGEEQTNRQTACDSIHRDRVIYAHCNNRTRRKP